MAINFHSVFSADYTAAAAAATKSHKHVYCSDIERKKKSQLNKCMPFILVYGSYFRTLSYEMIRQNFHSVSSDANIPSSSLIIFAFTCSQPVPLKCVVHLLSIFNHSNENAKLLPVWPQPYSNTWNIVNLTHLPFDVKCVRIRIYKFHEFVCAAQKLWPPAIKWNSSKTIAHSVLRQMNKQAHLGVLTVPHWR